MSLKTTQRAAVSAALCLLLPVLDCAAATMNVSPVRVEIGPAERSAVVTLRNEGQADASLQADIRSWSQDEDGKDVLLASDDLLIVPRIFTVPAGGSQVVRIGKLVESGDDVQGTYRLIITELATEQGAREGSGISVRLRLSLPVFLEPKGGAEAAIEVVRTQVLDEQLEIVVKNAGNATEQVLGFRLDTAGGTREPDQEYPVGGYLLPGMARRFTVALPADTDIRAVTVLTNQTGAVQYVLPGNN